MENHSDISKNFIPYDLALELKDLGFNEECFAWYNMSQDSLCFFGNDCCADMYAGEELRPEAPLWQQAARFLYINSNKQINITINGEDNYKRLCEKFKKAIEDFRNL